MQETKNRFSELRGDEKDDCISATLERNHRATAQEVAAATGLSIFTVRYRLLTLELAGAVKSERARNRIYYCLAERSQ
ncbi:MAG: FaeA/PapI family transcriptional regulator [Halobacteriota archaeon]